MRELLHRHLIEVTIAKVVPAGAGVAFVAIATRWFDTAAYGVFSIAFTAANLVAVLGAVWLSQSVLRFAGRVDSDVPIGPVVGTALLLCLAGAAATAGIAVVRPGTVIGSSAGVALGFVLLATALAGNTILGAFATSRQHFVAYRRSELARGLLLVMLTPLAAWAGAQGGAALIGAYAAATLVPAAALFLGIRSPGPMTASTPSPGRWAWAAPFARYGLPMTVWSGLQASQALMERAVMSTALSPERFGGFMAAVDVLTRGFGLALMPVVTLLHSRLMAQAGARRQLDGQGRGMLRSGSVLILLGAVVLGGVVWAAIPWLAAVAPALAGLPGSVVAAMCASGTLWILALVAHKPLEVSCATKEMSLLLLSALAVQFVLLVLLAPRWSELAMPFASCAAALAYIAGCSVLSARLARRPVTE